MAKINRNIAVILMLGFAIVMAVLLCKRKNERSEGYSDPVYLDEERIRQMEDETNGQLGYGVFSGYAVTDKAY